jgi:VanZ family protein
VLVGLFYGVSLQATVPLPAVVGLDKVLHAGAYGLLGILLLRAAGRDAGVWVRVALVGLGVLVGVGDEAIQSGVEGRTSTATDVLADAVGVILGVSWWGLVTRSPEDERT